MNKKTIIELIIIIILAVILGIFTYSTIKVINPDEETSINEIMQEMKGNSSNSAESTGATTITAEQTLSGTVYKSTTADESAIKVSNGGNATIENSTITKSGDSTNTENSEFYGVNAGILTTSNSTTTIKNSNITTSAKGANAVFATGTDSKVYVSNTTIKTTGSRSARGLDATYGGYIEADNVTISTEGGSCATLATDRGEGTVIAKNSKLYTKGAGSPIIYSTGDIKIENTEGTATGSQMCVIEGKNTATVTNSSLDAGEGVGTFNATESTLEILSSSSEYKTSPFFFITNTKAVINLENNTLKYGSNVLLKVAATSEWGNSGSNGGTVTLNAKKQTLDGNIEVDKISTAEINLKESSSLKGTINSANTAKEIKLTLEKSSTLTLTGDSYVTSLTDEDKNYSNINFNGYKLYVNGTAIN